MVCHARIPLTSGTVGSLPCCPDLHRAFIQTCHKTNNCQRHLRQHPVSFDWAPTITDGCSLYSMQEDIRGYYCVDVSTFCRRSFYVILACLYSLTTTLTAIYPHSSRSFGYSLPRMLIFEVRVNFSL